MNCAAVNHGNFRFSCILESSVFVEQKEPIYFYVKQPKKNLWIKNQLVVDFCHCRTYSIREFGNKL